MSQSIKAETVDGEVSGGTDGFEGEVRMQWPVVIPLRLHLLIDMARGSGSAIEEVSTAYPRISIGPESAVGIGLEKIPFIVSDYDDRAGYATDFLGVELPLPDISDESTIGTMKDGNPVIPYEHFSVVLNKHRRMAWYTASNVDGSSKKRRPEPGDYSRKGLGELGSASETWVVDPRVSIEYQLSDQFYNKDRGSFDKGHIVRREDVCWGDSRLQIQKANGDTFHLTNCSPQVGNFNRSNLGGIWGKLEDEVLGQLKKSKGRYSIFAGPAYADSDPEFTGWSETGSIIVNIPQEYWKVISFQDDGELRTFAFVLRQSLKNVRFEEVFSLISDWAPYLVSLEYLESRLEGVEFPDELHDADQFDTDAASELLSSTILRRQK
ncbi:MAG: DNA/RNA non-specific endonuclease [Candidatus Obscuribacterales bacterium]